MQLGPSFSSGHCHGTAQTKIQYSNVGWAHPLKESPLYFASRLHLYQNKYSSGEISTYKTVSLKFFLKICPSLGEKWNLVFCVLVMSD